MEKELSAGYSQNEEERRALYNLNTYSFSTFTFTSNFSSTPLPRPPSVNSLSSSPRRSAQRMGSVRQMGR